jgi:hypothetical protein
MADVFADEEARHLDLPLLGQPADSRAMTRAAWRDKRDEDFLPNTGPRPIRNVWSIDYRHRGTTRKPTAGNYQDSRAKMDADFRRSPNRLVPENGAR